MKSKIALGLVFLIVPIISFAAFVPPAVGCNLQVSNNFVQKNDVVTFSYTSSSMASLAVTKRMDNGVIIPVTTSNVMNGSLSVPVDVSATYDFAFSSVNGSASCRQMVRIPNVINPVR